MIERTGCAHSPDGNHCDHDAMPVLPPSLLEPVGPVVTEMELTQICCHCCGRWSVTRQLQPTPAGHGKYYPLTLAPEVKPVQMVRPAWDVVAGVALSRSAIVACRCGKSLHSMEAVREHWQAGHFDYVDTAPVVSQEPLAWVVLYPDGTPMNHLFDREVDAKANATERDSVAAVCLRRP